jgi:hypothetical protein
MSSGGYAVYGPLYGVKPAGGMKGSGGVPIYGALPVGGASATGGIDAGAPTGGTNTIASYAPDYGVGIN